MPVQTRPVQVRPSGAGRAVQEIEIKLDADARFVLPDLTSLPGVASVQVGEVQELKAVYVDTADLTLARHGVTFRRRTGGADAGWHLKLPAVKKGRTEVQRPAGKSIRAVPGELQALARVHLRGAVVEPVARIRTRRGVHRLVGAAGQVLAELADDLVSAEAMGAELTTAERWREIEVELVDGDEALLRAARKLLVGAGARPAGRDSKLARALGERLTPRSPASPPSAARGKGRKAASSGPSAGEVAVEYVAAQVEALLRQDPQVRLDAEDGVHQMRVATRRARTALATFRPLFAPGSVEPIRDELKWLAGVLGQARDAEVMRAHLKRDVAALPDDLVLGPVARRIDLELRAAYRDAHAHVVEALDGDRYLNLVRALESFVEAAPYSERAGTAAETEVQRLARKACRRVGARLDDLEKIEDAEQRDHQLHEIRIAAKRARYAAEAARGSVGRRAKRTASAMEAIQEVLGNHQDAVVEREWLRDLGARAFLAEENGFTFGLLHGLTRVRAAHDEEEFQVVWRQARRTLAKWPG